MADKKKVPIKYTSRDFESIRQDLLDYARRYYSDSYRDFSEASFGSLMVDSVAYIGDILSFYLDYQVNESFLDTATDFNNIIRIGRQMGYNYGGSAAAFGQCAFIVKVPADSVSLGPDTNYIPTLQKGSTIASSEGATFILEEDINFNNPAAQVEAAEQDPSTGRTTYWAIQTFGKVMSGELGLETIAVGPFERFKKIKLKTRNVVEVISVVDSEGNEYFEVENLSQNLVYKSISNRNYSGGVDAVSILKPMVVPRRFVIDRDRAETTLQFGFGSSAQTNSPSVAEPTNVVLKKNGRNYISDTSFDPSKLLDTDKFGVGPSNTTLTIRYRKNTVANTNASARSIRQIVNSNLSFEDPSILNSQIRRNVATSLEVINYDPIVGDVRQASPEELRVLIKNNFSAQNRAVTSQDYKALIYSMPPQFGAVKRCSIFRDSDSFRRDLNLYVVCEDNSGFLAHANNNIKTNLKTWLGQNKIINDTISVLDAKIVNIRIRYSAVAAVGANKYEILVNVNKKLKEMFLTKLDIGEPFNISEIYKAVNRVRGIVDVQDVKVENVTGTNYSNVSFDIDQNTTADGRLIEVPSNAILEIKYLDSDIVGSIE